MCPSLKGQWWTFAIQPTTAALFTQRVSSQLQRLLFFLIGLELPVFVFSRTVFFFTSVTVSQQLGAPRPIQLVLRHAAFSSFFDAHFADVSDCFLRGAECRFLVTQTLDLIVTLNGSVRRFSCAIDSFHPSLCFDCDLSCVQLSCVQCTTPFPLLPALRSRLIAGAELYIQVNS